MTQALKNILVGKIVAAHGIKGCIKIKSYTVPPTAICEYSPLIDTTGKEYKISLKSAGKNDVIIVSIDDINDRNAAELLKGIELYTPRSSVIDNDEDLLIPELIDFKVIDNKEKEIGKIINVLNYGAGSILEVEIIGVEKTALLSMNKDSVIEINNKKGYIKIDREHLLES